LRVKGRKHAIWAIWAALCAALLMPQPAAAAGSGSFSPTGSLSVPREGAGAAPLPDGRVLVAGGYFFDGAHRFLATAEAFNPPAGGFSTAGIGSMGTARYFAAAAPLLDGRVLVTGGETPPMFAVTKTAEVFNPQTGTFSPVGPMQAARDGHAMALLPDGRVLVAGVGTPNAEVFNPQTNTFSSAGIGQMSTTRIGPIAAPLLDGRVLVAGGLGPGGRLSSAEVFNPQTNTFSSAGIGSMTTPRYLAAAARLPDGRVLVAGGQTSSNVSTASAEVFDPATNSFSSAGIGSMGTARTTPVAAPLPDGRVLVAGGVMQSPTASNYLSSAEIFAATNSFSVKVKGKKLIVSVQASGEVLLSDAKVPLNASMSKKGKKKKRRLLKPSSAPGDPPTISVPFRLTKLAKAKLRRKGKLSVTARITFTPLGGLANTQTAKLKIKGNKRK
jgi:hypothetical protein